MAKRVVKKKANPNEMDGKEFFEAIHQIEQEKGIKPGYMMEKVTQALLSAYRRDHEGVGDNLVIEADEANSSVRLFLKKEIVEEVENPNREILLEKAKEDNAAAEVGGFVRLKLDTKQFGRVAAQTARNIIRQGIRDSERGQMMQEFQSKHQELVSGLVERVDMKTGAITLRIGKAEAVLPKNEQIGEETVREGDYIKVYVVDVRETEKGPKAIISRTHPDLVKRMFEQRCRRSTTAPWRSRRFPERPAPAQSLRCSATTPMWTRWARASAPGAPEFPRS